MRSHYYTIDWETGETSPIRQPLHRGLELRFCPTFRKSLRTKEFPAECFCHLQAMAENLTGRKHVAEEMVGTFWISTVFLPINHEYWDDGPPILFETMIFNQDRKKIDIGKYGLNRGEYDYSDLGQPDLGEYQTRCSTFRGALGMHDRTVEWVHMNKNLRQTIRHWWMKVRELYEGYRFHEGRPDRGGDLSKLPSKDGRGDEGIRDGGSGPSTGRLQRLYLLLRNFNLYRKDGATKPNAGRDEGAGRG